MSFMKTDANILSGKMSGWKDSNVAPLQKFVC